MLIRKLYFVFYMVLFFSILNAYADDTNFKLGISGGPNITFISFEPYGNINVEDYHKTGYNLLIYTDYQLSNSFDISAGVRYSVMSSKFKDNTKIYLGVEIYRHLTFTRKYFLVPIKIKYFPNRIRNLYLIAGTEVGYLESSELLAEKLFSSDKEFYDFYSAYNKYIEFLFIGIGYKHRILSLKTIIELNYFKGLYNNLNDNYQDFFWFREWMTNKLTLNFGIEL